MSDTQTQTQQTSTPAPTFIGGVEFSPQEVAYFESRGESAEGLATEAPATEQGAETTQPAETTQQATEQSSDDGDADGGIVITANGQVKDAKTGRFVPHKAFHAERERRKTVEADLAKERERAARFDERLAVLNEALKGNVQPTQQAQEQEPDPEKDVFAYLKWQKQKIDELKTQLSKTSNDTQVQLARNTLRQHYEGEVARYAKDQPHFEAAKKFLVEGRHKELEALGIADKDARQKLIDQQEADIALNAYKNKQSAPDVLYKLAMARGFAPPAANGQQKSEAEQKLERIEQGQRAAASLTNASGGVAGELTAQQLIDMPEDKFAALSKTEAGKALIRKYLG